MIYYVTGALGAGKSAYGARKASRALLQGRVVATNVRFVDGWEQRVLRHSPYYRFTVTRRRREAMQREIRTRYLYEPDFGRLLSARIRGRGEGRGVRVFDEAHNEMNNRDWANENQKVMLKRFTLSRKRGWDDYIISQHLKNTDAAVRRIASVEVKMTNWRQLARIPVFGTRLLPFHLFLAIGFPVEDAFNPAIQRLGKPLFREIFTLGWWAHVYDTNEDYELDDEDTLGAVWLPHPPQGGAPVAARSEAAPAKGAAVGAAIVNGVGGLPVSAEPPGAAS